MEVKLHDIGEGMTEAEINRFFVKLGDSVKVDEPLVEVQTDKMTAEIPAPKAGIIRKLTVTPGDTVKVGETLIILDTEKAVQKQILASPFTRKIARENEIDIENVIGTGPSGRIMDEDVYTIIASNNNHITPLVEKAKDYQFIDKTPIEQDSIPFRGRRKQIARKMVQSMFTIPHCTHFEEIDVTELIQFRSSLKEIREQISVTAFFLKALSVCLKEFPIFNARLDEEKEVIHLQFEHHIGIAVDTEDGLIVPVILNVERKSIRQLHTEIKELTARALANQLSLNDISGGTFTISNVGPLGGSFGATPIIQHPEVALVSFHKTKKMPVVTEDDEIVIRQMMNISMSFDHRVADGATAVRFTNRFAQLMKDPKLLLLELV